MKQPDKIPQFIEEMLDILYRYYRRSYAPAYSLKVCDEYREQINKLFEVPYNVSKWRAEGKRRGYWDYFKQTEHKKILQILKTYKCGEHAKLKKYLYEKSTIK